MKKVPTAKKVVAKTAEAQKGNMKKAKDIDVKDAQAVGPGPQPAEAPKELLINTEALNMVVKYLSEKPYNEVANIINAIQTGVKLPT